MPSLLPFTMDIMTLLKLQNNIKKDEKYVLFKAIYEKKIVLTDFLVELSPGVWALDKFIELLVVTSRQSSRRGATLLTCWANVYIDIRNALQLIIPRSQHHFALSE